jgi:hypothetical protein
MLLCSGVWEITWVSTMLARARRCPEILHVIYVDKLKSKGLILCPSIDLDRIQGPFRHIRADRDCTIASGISPSR